MFCKWCGMESTTTDQCSWCHRAFSANAGDGEETLEAPSAPAPNSARVSIGSPRTPEPEPPSLATGATPPAPPSETPRAPWGPPTASPVTPSPAPSMPPGSRPAQAGAPPVIGVRRPGGGSKPGHIPAPAMPPPAHAGHTTRPPAPIATSNPSSGSATTHPPVPAPSIGVNRTAGGNTPAHIPAPAIPAIKPRTPSAPSSRPAVPATFMGAAPAGTAPPTVLSGGAPSTSGSTALADAAPSAEPGGLADGLSAPPLSPAHQAATDAGVPPYGTFPAARSKYYPGQMVDPVSGAHYDSETGKPTSVTKPADKRPAEKRADDIVLNWDTPHSANTQLVARFAGVFAAILLVAGLTAHFLPDRYLVPLFCSQFVGALLLPVMGVVPWADEDTDHVWWFLLLALAVGPAAGLVVYTVISLLRQDANPAVVGCFVVTTLAQITVGMAAGGFAWTQLAPFVQVGGFNWRQVVFAWSGMASLVGWYAASVFHKLNE